MERVEKDSSAGSELAKAGGGAGGAQGTAGALVPPGGQQPQPQQLALKDVQCPICLKVFSRKFSLEMHFLIHQGLKPYKCQFCGRCFRQKGTLMRHKAIHSQTPSYRCGLCDKSYRQKNVFLHHLRNRHKVSTDVLDRRRCHIKNNNAGGGGGLMEALPPPSSTAPYAPPLPPPSLGSVCLPPLSPPEPLLPPPGELGGPTPQVAPPQDPPIILRFSEGSRHGLPPVFSGQSPLQLAGGSAAAWQCPFCAFESPHDPDVCRSHLLQHVGDPPPMDCPLCPQRLCSSAELGAHLRDFHESSMTLGASPPHLSRGVPLELEEQQQQQSRSSEVTFTCIPCQMEFGSEDDFDWHVKTHVQSMLSEPPSDSNGADCAGPLDLTEGRVDPARASPRPSTPRKPGSGTAGSTRRQLMCVECGKLFSSKALYRYHAQLHLAVQGTFRCPLCRLRFPRKLQLLQHTRQRHLRRLRCALCGRQFSYRSLHASHVRSCRGVPPPSSGPLCLPVVNIQAARGALGSGLLGVIPLVAVDGDEPSRILGVPVLAPDTVLKSRLNGLHVSARIGL